MVTLEEVLDKIADSLILDAENLGVVNPDLVMANQKTIREGLVSLGRTNAERLLLYQQDTKANAEDLIFTTEAEGLTLGQIVENFNTVDASIDDILVNLANTGTTEDPIIDIVLYYSEALQYNVTTILSDDNLNPINISQFVTISQQQTVVDPEKAFDYLDTTIFELLPTTQTRQERINKLFEELNILLPPDTPEFDINPKDNKVDRDSDGNWILNNQYYLNNSISATQDNPDQAGIDEASSFITRLKSNANDLNFNKTIEDIYNTVTPYLTDLLENQSEIQDERPEYQESSPGYLRFRNPNQGIIVRNINNEFIEGLNPLSHDYLDTGFTIAMWVRFKDKVSEGTLFNFGNPVRGKNPFGFRLETYTLGRDEQTGVPYDPDGDGMPDFPTWGQYSSEIAQEHNYYLKTDTERFVRLIVNDNGFLRDSHVGHPGRSKTSDVPGHSIDSDTDLGLMSATWVPENFNEWYYIVATFNPDVVEDDYVTSGTNNTGTNPAHGMCLQIANEHQCNKTPYFWRNNIDGDGYTHQSLQGNKCKVEIISKTKLLRARGYKV